MNPHKRKELVYRCIQISAWAKVVPPKNQNQRELLIAIDKINRLWFQDEVHFWQNKSKAIGLEYERVVKLVAKSFQDVAAKAGKTLSAAELNELMYGEKGLRRRLRALSLRHTAITSR